MKNLDLETCKCYWIDEEFHPEENVTMPSTFMQCETCKNLECDDNSIGLYNGEQYHDIDGNLHTMKLPHICDNCPDCGIKEGE